MKFVRFVIHAIFFIASSTFFAMESPRKSVSISPTSPTYKTPIAQPVETYQKESLPIAIAILVADTHPAPKPYSTQSCIADSCKLLTVFACLVCCLPGCYISHKSQK